MTSSGNYNAFGSYIQLSTLDDGKENVHEDAKPNILGTMPYRRFLCTKRDTIIVVIALVLAFIVISTTLVIGLPKIEEKKVQYYDTTIHPSSSPLRSYSSAAVLVDGKQCAVIGKSILQKNGSVVDAAIATLFCNGVVTPQSMGLGGGFFMVIYNKSSDHSEVIDARETAPAAATTDMFGSNRTLSTQGGLAVAVPGELEGYWQAFSKHGTLPWKDLIQPSIELCENGFEVSEHMATRLEMQQEGILAVPAMREQFVNNATAELFKKGEIMKRPVLAETLRIIADNGGEALHNGVLTKQFVQDIQDCGGIITEQDMNNYKSKVKDTLKIPLKGGDSPRTLLTAPAPSSGAIIAFIMNVLEGYDMTEASMEEIDDAVLTYHRIIETFKFAYAQRELLTDDIETDDQTNIKELIANLTSKEFASGIRAKISDERTYSPDYYELESGISSDHGTSHVSILAPNGDAVSVTSSVNTNFGSLCLSPSTGILLNNGMDDFSSPNITNFFNLPPNSRNQIEPNKRPVSSMSPSIVIDDAGEAHIVTGGIGGTHIITAVAQALLRMLWLNSDCKEATDAPRLHHQLIPNYISYEAGFPKVYLDRLKKFGHDIKLNTLNNAVLTIARKEDQIEANVDFRKGGSVDGF